MMGIAKRGIVKIQDSGGMKMLMCSFWFIITFECSKKSLWIHYGGWGDDEVTPFLSQLFALTNESQL
jgi:hypothetical protein